MFVWFNEARDLRTLINIDHIVRIGPSGEAGCVVILADGKKISIEHSIDSVAELLAQVTRHPVMTPR
jgi:hypothetical protein